MFYGEGGCFIEYTFVLELLMDSLYHLIEEVEKHRRANAKVVEEQLDESDDSLSYGLYFVYFIAFFIGLLTIVSITLMCILAYTELSKVLNKKKEKVFRKRRFRKNEERIIETGV